MRNTSEKAGHFVKKLIGIAPASFIGDPDKSCMADYYKLGNNYTKRIVAAGGIPFGLAPADNLLTEEALERCDSFLVQGGAEFYPYHFQIIHHAVTHGKKYLGICLGQQLIYVYLELRRRVEARGYSGDLVRAICEYLDEQGPGFSVQKRISGHRSKSAPRGMEDETKHDVNIVPGTLLHRVLGRDTMRIASFHEFNTPPEQTLVTINAWSATGDGVVEGTEYADHILGVQGHPEADGLLPELFRFLTED